MNTPESPKIDSHQLGAIAGDIPVVVLGIMGDFEKSFGEEIANLNSSLSEVTETKWVEFFHRIKGSGGTLGLVALQHRSAKLEEQVKAGILPSEGDLQDFRELFGDSCREGNSFLNDLAKELGA